MTQRSTNVGKHKGQLLNQFCDHHELLGYISRFVHGRQTTICHDSGRILYLICTDKTRMNKTETQDTVPLVETKSGSNETLIKIVHKSHERLNHQHRVNKKRSTSTCEATLTAVLNTQLKD